MKFGPGLTTYQFKRQLDHVKYRLYFKKAPYLKTLNLHDRNAAKYMTVAELHQKGIDQKGLGLLRNDGQRFLRVVQDAYNCITNYG